MTREASPGRGPDRSPRLLVVAALACFLGSGLGCAARQKKARASLPTQQVYEMAMRKIAHKRYYTGRGLLQELMPRVPPDDREILPKIQIAIADAFFKDGGHLNFGEALNSYRTFLTYYPNHEEAARAQFMVGMSLYEQGLSPDRDQTLTLQAITEFEKVGTVYPTSPFVPQAAKMIVTCHDRLAEHERLVGAFYQKRKRYNAAIDRYRKVLETYPQYNNSGQVLLDIGTCLLRVGNRPEADEFFGRLFQDHPDGKLANRARQMLAEYDKRQQKEGRKEPKG